MYTSVQVGLLLMQVNKRPMRKQDTLFKERLAVSPPLCITKHCLRSLGFLFHVGKFSHSVLTLCATLWIVAHQTSLTMGFFKARILEWVAISSSRGSSPPRDRTLISCISGGFFTIEPLRKHFDSIAQFNYVNILEGLLNK